MKNKNLQHQQNTSSKLLKAGIQHLSNEELAAIVGGMRLEKMEFSSFVSSGFEENPNITFEA